jgi:multisubunit Na+/H+ antiporter MnhG subunit
MPDWTKYGAWGALGCLLGIAAVFWIRPATSGGIGLIILVGILLAIVVRGVLT